MSCIIGLSRNASELSPLGITCACAGEVVSDARCVFVFVARSVVFTK